MKQNMTDLPSWLYCLLSEKNEKLYLFSGKLLADLSPMYDEICTLGFTAGFSWAQRLRWTHQCNHRSKQIKESEAKKYLQPVVLERLRHETSGLVHTMFLQLNAHYVIGPSSGILTTISSLTVSKTQSDQFLGLCNSAYGQPAEIFKTLSSF